MTADIPAFSQKPLTAIIIKQETPPSKQPIQYTVLEKDTLTKIASDQHTTVQRLFDKNTSIVNPDQIKPGDKLVVPENDEVLTHRDMISSTLPKSAGTAVTGGSSRFEWGWCTYFADQQRPDIHAQGNAADWIRYANYSVPVVGAVAVNTWAAGGYGHVGIVRDFNATQVLVESMNFTAGFGKVSTDWVDRGYWAGYIM